MNTCHLLPLLFLLLPRISSPIRCFECYTVTHPSHIDDDVVKKLCRNFDYSDNFIIDCGNSTYCRKTVMREVILHSLVEVERGCASQLYVGLTLNGGAWKSEQKVVTDAYKDECSHVENYGLRNVKVENCYCKTDLCNSSTFVKYSIVCLSLSIIVFIRNLVISNKFRN